MSLSSMSMEVSCTKHFDGPIFDLLPLLYPFAQAHCQAGPQGALAYLVALGVLISVLNNFESSAGCCC